MQKISISRALATQFCNLSYSEGRDQEDCGSKPGQESSSCDPILKILITKWAVRVAQGEDPEFMPQYHQINLNIIM
jgi:hypothetical protein